MRFMLGLLLVLALPAGSANAQATYGSLWVEAIRDPSCRQEEYRDFVLVACERRLTVWYFSKPNHRAHPGVIERKLVRMPNGAWHSVIQGRSFGPDSLQPAFKAWLAEIEELDRQMKEAIEREYRR